MKDLPTYSDDELEVPEEKIKKLIEFFEEHGINYDKFDPNNIPKLVLNEKSAYPNNDQYMYVPGQRDTQKWLAAINDIYQKEQSGNTKKEAIRQATTGWPVVETFDFLNWVRFYEAGNHMKYKVAQLWYENNALGPGYFLQVKKDQQVEDKQPTEDDVGIAQERAVRDQERRQTIERQRNKIIGRLDSAEKLLRSSDGHVFSGKEFESLLESIYQLKKKIQMINKISVSTRLYSDMIVRQANVLTKQGFSQAALVLHKLAQTPGAITESAEGATDGSETITPPSPGDPSGAGQPGAPGGTPSTGPGMPQGGPPSANPHGIENANSPGMEKFLQGLEQGQYSPTDEQGVDDELEVSDSLDSDDELLVEAQVSPRLGPNDSITTDTSPAPLTPSPVSAPSEIKEPKAPKAPKLTSPSKDETLEEGGIEVSEKDIPNKIEPHSTSKFDARVEEVFSNITVADVVTKLEDLSKIFKTREVPRQLGVVDMMLDSLGIASFFPSLSEATNKALESNNYISTRIEDIISKLRGSMATHNIDLKGDAPERADVAGVKSKLKSDQEKEVARKQMRREQENAELENSNKETPEIEIEEEVATPTVPVPSKLV